MVTKNVRNDFALRRALLGLASKDDVWADWLQSWSRPRLSQFLIAHNKHARGRRGRRLIAPAAPARGRCGLRRRRRAPQR